MKFSNAKIDGLVICEQTKYFDERGFFSETFRKDLFQDFIGYNIDFCQENFSKSKKIYIKLFFKFNFFL